MELSMTAVGLLTLCIPTYIALNAQVWNIVGQGHGPVMLALALWLFWKRFPALQKIDGKPSIVGGIANISIGSLLYIIGRSQDILALDVTSHIFIAAGIILIYWGWAGLKRMWFPLFFLIFLIPLPSPVVDTLTGPLKSSVSYVAEQILFLCGYPVGRAGVTLTIGQYKLLVADACAGLNSIFALEAIGVFYMSIAEHTSKARNIILAILIGPISFLSNTIRVITLVLVTYYFGDEAGQGFVHGFAGILLFMVATALTILTDSILGYFFHDTANQPEVRQ